MTGLHGRAERGTRGTTVYLLPGLATGQRRAVIRRLRQEAGRGFGPPLPQPQLAIALALDRVRAAMQIMVAIVRLHPALTLLPGAVVAVLMALFVISSADGPGGVPKLTGLAAAPLGDGVKDLGAVITRPASTRMTMVTVTMGARHKRGGKKFRIDRPDRPQCAAVRRPRGKLRALLDWYVCAQPITGPVPNPRG